MHRSVVVKGFTLVKKKTEFLDKSSKTIDTLPVLFEPKWSSSSTPHI